MSIWLECVIGIFAAVGLICILKAVYDIIFTGYFRTDGQTELFLYASGTDPKVEQLIATAAQIRRMYLPALIVVFVENGEADPEKFNYAKALCTRRHMEYIE